MTSEPFPAPYHARCHECPEEIQAGDPIVYYNGFVMHADCDFRPISREE